MEGWQNVVESMDSEHRHMLRGLGNFFLRDSLTICHPIFMGGYGLIFQLPSARGDLCRPFYWRRVFSNWKTVALPDVCNCRNNFHTRRFSILVSTIVKRPGSFILGGFFVLPFIGLTVLSASVIDNQYEIILDRIGWFIYILPGPLWIHLSYAPRWRIIDRIDRGIEPFEGMKMTVYGNTKTVGPESDFDLEEVIDII